MKQKFRNKKILAVMVSLAMLFSSISGPTFRVKAADTVDPATIGTTSDKVTASFEKGSSSDGAYREYFIKVTNQLSESISDWIIVIDMTGISKVEQWSSWADVQAYSDGKKMYIVPTNTKTKGAQIAAGSSVGGSSVPEWKIGYVGTQDISGYTLYYKTGSTYTGAFEKVVNSAGGGGIGDSTTDVNLDVKYNFAKAFQYSLYLYDANMCGSDVENKSAFTWRKNCHLEDQTITYQGKTVDVSGGYHDAGDFVKFNLPQAYSMTTLGIGLYEFKDAFVELGQSGHMKLIMDRFAEYFENCTVLDENGKVKTYCYQVGEGNSDHGYWGAPEKQSNRSSLVYFTSDSKPCTDIVAETAAALAIYAVNYKTEDSAASQKALKYAKALFTYAEESPKGLSKDTVAGGFYAGSKYEDDMALASIWLYKATNDASYKTKYDSYVGKCSTGWVMSWDDVSAAAYVYGGSSQASNVKAIIQAQANKTSPQGFAYVDGSWGSARYNTALQLIGLAQDNEYGTQDYQDWALGQMKYIMGNSTSKRNFIVGYNENSPKYIHHRAASGYNDVSSNATTPLAHTIYGALAGGPNAQDQYTDSATAYQYSEVAIDYNAGFVGALAGLYLYTKGKADYSSDQYLVTKDSPEADDEISIYYGDGSSLPTPTATANVTPTATATATANATATAEASISPSGTPVAGSSANPSGTPEAGSSANPSGTPAAGSSSNPSGTPAAGSSSNPSGTPAAGSSSNPSGTPAAGSSSNPSGTLAPGSSSNPSGTLAPGSSSNPSDNPANSDLPSQTDNPGQSSDPDSTTNPGSSSEPETTQSPDLILDESEAVSNNWDGADVSLVNQVIAAQKTDKDIKGSVFARLSARVTSTKTNKQVIKWKKVSGASGYLIYGNRCGKNRAMKLLATVSKSKTSWTHKKLKKGTYYKYTVIAFKNVGDKKQTICVSKMLHSTTNGGKKTNAKSVKLSFKKVKLSKKKTKKIKAKVIAKIKKKKISKHRALAYESSNPNIATVSSKGKIKALRKGKCVIYVYAQNGVYGKVNVTVK